MKTLTVREQILEHAVTLIMLRGYNGFSYRDLSALVGVKTSSIHYYFAAKDDLVLEAVKSYSAEVLASIASIGGQLSATEKLDRYIQLFGRILGNGDHICLCGMLAADIQSLPEPVRLAVQQFFSANEAWLSEVLTQGAEQKTLVVHGNAPSAARALFAALQGAVLASRLFNSKARLDDIAASWRL